MVPPIITINYESCKVIITIFGRKFEFFNSFKFENDNVSKKLIFDDFKDSPVPNSSIYFYFCKLEECFSFENYDYSPDTHFKYRLLCNPLFLTMCFKFKKTKVYLFNKSNNCYYFLVKLFKRCCVSFLHHARNVLIYKVLYLTINTVFDIRGISYFFMWYNRFYHTIWSSINSYFIGFDLRTFTVSINHFVLNRLLYYIINSLIYLGVFNIPLLNKIMFYFVCTIRYLIDIYLYALSSVVLFLNKCFYTLRVFICSVDFSEWIFITWVMWFLFVNWVLRFYGFYLILLVLIWSYLFSLHIFMYELESPVNHTVVGATHYLYNFLLFIFVIILILACFIINFIYKIIYILVDLNILLLLFILNEYIVIYNDLVPKPWNIYIFLNIPVYNSIYMHYYAIWAYIHVSYDNLYMLTHSFIRTPYRLEWLHGIQYSSFSYYPIYDLYNFELGRTSITSHILNPQPRLSHLPINTIINDTSVINGSFNLFENTNIIKTPPILENAPTATNDAHVDSDNSGWYFLIGVFSVVVICVVVDCICNT